MLAEEELALGVVVAEGGTGNGLAGLTGLTDAVAGAKRHRKAVQEAQRLAIHIGPEEDGLAQMVQQLPHPLGTRSARRAKRLSSGR